MNIRDICSPFLVWPASLQPQVFRNFPPADVSPGYLLDFRQMLLYILKASGYIKSPLTQFYLSTSGGLCLWSVFIGADQHIFEGAFFFHNCRKCIAVKRKGLPLQRKAFSQRISTRKGLGNSNTYILKDMRIHTVTKRIVLSSRNSYVSHNSIT